MIDAELYLTKILREQIDKKIENELIVPFKKANLNVATIVFDGFKVKKHYLEEKDRDVSWFADYVNGKWKVTVSKNGVVTEYEFMGLEPIYGIDIQDMYKIGAFIRKVYSGV